MKLEAVDEKEVVCWSVCLEIFLVLFLIFWCFCASAGVEATIGSWLGKSAILIGGMCLREVAGEAWGSKRWMCCGGSNLGWVKISSLILSVWWGGGGGDMGSLLVAMGKKWWGTGLKVGVGAYTDEEMGVGVGT